MNKRKDLDVLLRSQPFTGDDCGSDTVYSYAMGMAQLENCLVVVSDLKANTSRIFHSKFSTRLGLDCHAHENSIWENDILGLMDEQEREEKYLSELRFFNFLRRVPGSRRKEYYLATHLRLYSIESVAVDVMHRMYYWYENNNAIVRYAVCVYGPLAVPLPAKSMAVNSVTGETLELSSASDNKILSKRETQILALIETGMTSRDIAERLCISKHTVSRHRQEILSNLQARNSAEAIRMAKLLKLI